MWNISSSPLLHYAASHEQQCHTDTFFINGKMGIRLLPFVLYFLTCAGFVWFSSPQISLTLELLLVLDVPTSVCSPQYVLVIVSFLFGIHFLQRTKTLGLSLTFENYSWENFVKVLSWEQICSKFDVANLCKLLFFFKCEKLYATVRRKPT